MTIKPLVAGNWKMNGLRSTLAEFTDMSMRFSDQLANAVDLMICPPAPLIYSMRCIGGQIMVGAQDCHANETGAHTGDVAAEMLVDSGARAIIVGHSERRADHGEENGTVRAKAEAANRAGAVAIVCVGETREERESGDAVTVVMSQLEGSLSTETTAENTIIAYEPVWAIGTGLTPTVADVSEMHTAIRGFLSQRFAGEGENMRLLYGGSVKPGNAAELMAVENVNGALVGGASLKCADFMEIAETYLQ